MNRKLTILLLISLFHLQVLQLMAQKNNGQWNLQDCMDYAQKKNKQNKPYAIIFT